MANRAERVITCSRYMREHVADIYGLEEARVTVIPNGIDPLDLEPVDDLDDAARALRRARRAARAAGRPARLREGLPARARGAARPDRAARATCASSSPARARTSRSCASRRRELGPRRARHVPRLDRRRRAALALPDRRPDAWCRRSTSRSGWSRSRRWPRAARASWPTPAACARSCRTRTSGCASAARDPELARRQMAERLLTDDELRDRLVAEASEHVLTLRLGRRRPPGGARSTRRSRSPRPATRRSG